MTNLSDSSSIQTNELFKEARQFLGWCNLRRELVHELYDEIQGSRQAILRAYLDLGRGTRETTEVREEIQKRTTR